MPDIGSLSGKIPARDSSTLAHDNSTLDRGWVIVSASGEVFGKMISLGMGRLQEKGHSSFGPAGCLLPSGDIVHVFETEKIASGFMKKNWRQLLEWSGFYSDDWKSFQDKTLRKVVKIEANLTLAGESHPYRGWLLETDFLALVLKMVTEMSETTDLRRRRHPYVLNKTFYQLLEYIGWIECFGGHWIWRQLYHDLLKEHRRNKRIRVPLANRVSENASLELKWWRDGSYREKACVASFLALVAFGAGEVCP